MEHSKHHKAVVEEEKRILQNKANIEDQEKAAQIMLLEYQKKVEALQKQRIAVEKEERLLQKRKLYQLHQSLKRRSLKICKHFLLLSLLIKIDTRTVWIILNTGMFINL